MATTILLVPDATRSIVRSTKIGFMSLQSLGPSLHYRNLGHRGSGFSLPCEKRYYKPELDLHEYRRLVNINMAGAVLPCRASTENKYFIANPPSAKGRTAEPCQLNGTIALRTSTGKMISTKQSGHATHRSHQPPLPKAVPPPCLGPPPGGPLGVNPPGVLSVA